MSGAPQICIFVAMPNYFYDQLNLETAFLVSPVILPLIYFIVNNIGTPCSAQRFQTQYCQDVDDGEGGPSFFFSKRNWTSRFLDGIF